jgi:hypothetical protein
MHFKPGIVLLLTLTTMIFSSAEIVNFLPLTLQGKVVDLHSGKPVKGAHVYIVRGEEEVFSSANGEFVLKTWQPLPVEITVEYNGYKRQTARFSAQTKKLVISLSSVN